MQDSLNFVLAFGFRIEGDGRTVNSSNFDVKQFVTATADSAVVVGVTVDTTQAGNKAFLERSKYIPKTADFKPQLGDCNDPFVGNNNT